MTDQTLAEFSAALGSKAPTPGGGAACALVGALAAALGKMVCDLSLGKAAYAAYEEQNARYSAQLEAARVALLDLMQADEDAFKPVSAAYAIPKDDPERPAIMESALKGAVEPPLAMMRLAAQVIDVLAELPGKSSRLAVSDVGVAASFAAAALESAALNVYVNTAAMADADAAAAFDEEAAMYLKALPAARALFSQVADQIKRTE